VDLAASAEEGTAVVRVSGLRRSDGLAGGDDPTDDDPAVRTGGG